MAGRELQMLKSKVASLEYELDELRETEEPHSNLAADLQQAKQQLHVAVAARTRLAEQIRFGFHIL